MKSCLLLSAVLATAACTHIATTPQNRKRSWTPEEFLGKFGYLPKGNGQTGLIITEEAFTEAVKKFQKNYGLPETGVIDEETKEAMEADRCGNSDEGMASPGRRKRQSRAWPRTALTYNVTQYTGDLSRQQVDDTIRAAFKVWEDVTPLRFTSVTSVTPDIIIKFASGRHGDGSRFDGRGGVLAHAYFPTIGDAHFDNDETWTIDTKSGINLFQVAAHEFGHSLGLGHSGVRGALMYPSYRGYNPNFRLAANDISRIQGLYGRGGNPGSPTPATPPTPPTPRTVPTQPPRTQPPPTWTTQSTPPTQPPPPGGISACDVTTWDAVTQTRYGDVFFFAGDFYYKITRTGAAFHQPREIARDWAGAPGSLDTVVTVSSGYTLLVKDTRFYLFRGQRRMDQHVRSLTNFKGFPNTLEAAWIWNNRFYVTEGSQYWRYNRGDRVQDARYPRIFNAWWRGAPSTIDAAARINSVTHFFKGQHYYKFTNQYSQGPYSTSRDFFKCS